MYAAIEGGIFATQTWDYEGMTFVPNLDFLEFIPENEVDREKADKYYRPKTVLLDEVQAEEIYELVITNFHNGIMTRYRIGDMVRITALRNEKLNIDIPQMIFERRADDLIDVTCFGRLTEKIIWQAIEDSGIPYVDWTARKEIVKDKSVLHLYIELKGGHMASEETIAAVMYDEIVELNNIFHYNQYLHFGGEPMAMLGYKPLIVTLLPSGSFRSYIAQRQAEGADLGHLKPTHINPSDKVLSLLGYPRVVEDEVQSIEAEHAVTG